MSIELVMPSNHLVLYHQQEVRLFLLFAWTIAVPNYPVLCLPPSLPYLDAIAEALSGLLYHHIPSPSASPNSSSISISPIVFRMKPDCLSGLLFCLSSPHPPELCLWLCEYVIYSRLPEFVPKIAHPTGEILMLLPSRRMYLLVAGKLSLPRLPPPFRPGV